MRARKSRWVKPQSSAARAASVAYPWPQNGLPRVYAQLRSRPAVREVDADPAHERAGRLVGDRPRPIAAEHPVAQPRGHGPPAVLAGGDRAVTEVADDVRILEQGAEDVCVGLDQGPEDEPLRLEGRDVERRHRQSPSRPLRSGDDPLPGLAAAERHHAPVPLADALGHRNRRGVGRVDQADQLVAAARVANPQSTDARAASLA